ncbi:hypothetical protein [Streptomyces sp. NPDC054794]
MTTRFDDDPEFAPDDPLAVILRPASEPLGPPPGRYEAIRRAAARRRVLRAAAGLGATCAVAALVVLPLRLSADDAPARPAIPLAPPPPTRQVTPSPSVSPTRSAAPESPRSRPTHAPETSTHAPDTPTSRYPTRRAVPTPAPSTTPSAARTEPTAGGRDTVTPGSARP